MGDLHQAEITYIEWSKNGMRLFSGDKNGLVVMTEIDFYMVCICQCIFCIDSLTFNFTVGGIANVDFVNIKNLWIYKTVLEVLWVS